MTVISMFDLSGQVALVMGGSRGLGLEMVLAFADAGADVIIASRKLDACEAAAEQVRARGPPYAWPSTPRRWLSPGSSARRSG
jgi:NAD(P)-dependent dehydrogenase (short-subunit alcohol dehydrogenase family)